MSNPLTTGQGQTSQQLQINPQQAMQQLRSDPVGMLKQAGFNVPENLAGDPGGMIQHLVQSGQVPQTRVTQLMQMMRGRR